DALALEPVDVGDAAGHAGAEVAPDAAEDHRETARHVFERVVADALHDRGRAGVAHEEALPHEAADEDAPARRAVADDVAGDDVLLRGVDAEAVRADDDLAAGEALA